MCFKSNDPRVYCWAKISYLWLIFHNLANGIFISISINCILTIHPIRMTPSMTSEILRICCTMSWHTMCTAAATISYKICVKTNYIRWRYFFSFFFFFCLFSYVSFGTLFYSTIIIVKRKTEKCARVRPNNFVVRCSRMAKSLHMGYNVGEQKNRKKNWSTSAIVISAFELLHSVRTECMLLNLLCDTLIHLLPHCARLLVFFSSFSIRIKLNQRAITESLLRIIFSIA